MSLVSYPGNCPSNTNKDAKYTVKRAGVDGWAVHLQYTVSSRARELLTTSAHPDLVELVNDVKRRATGVEGGAFYINEFGHVLVPTVKGTFYAGRYSKELKFGYEGTTIAPSAPADLRPGDEWPGPHVGILHRVTAGTDDIFYTLKPTSTRTQKVLLSDERGKSAASRLARRLARVKGVGGGRVYINERCEFFAPVDDALGLRYVYLGHLEEDAWFLEFDMGD